MSVYVESNLKGFFGQEVRRAFDSDPDLRTRNVISAYVTKALDRLARMDRILILPPEKARPSVISFSLTPVYIEYLQHLGDSTLVVNSIFPGFLYDNKINPDENRDLGVLAYRRISSSYQQQPSAGSFFRTLGNLYPKIEEALSGIRIELNLDTWEAFLKRLFVSSQ